MAELFPTRAFCCGVLHAMGTFDPAGLTADDRIDTANERVWFALGETTMAGLLALTVAAPAGYCCAKDAGPVPALTAAVIIFLPLFVFVPKLMRYATHADTGAVIVAFGKNEQIKKVFWTVFFALASLVLAQVAGPETVEQVLAVLAGI